MAILTTPGTVAMPGGGTAGGQWMLGPDMGNQALGRILTLEPAYINVATGALVFDSAPMSIVGILARFEPTHRRTTQNVKPITQYEDNEVVIGTGSHAAIETMKYTLGQQILRRCYWGAGGSLTDPGQRFTHLRVTWQDDNDESQINIFTMTDFDDHHNQPGVNTCTLTLAPFKPVGDQTTQHVYIVS